MVRNGGPDERNFPKPYHLPDSRRRLRGVSVP